MMKFKSIEILPISTPKAPMLNNKIFDFVNLAIA